ncbi:MAG: PP2C family protein-serine/threonine phosphatase [Pseudobdellovibrio sp.]
MADDFKKNEYSSEVEKLRKENLLLEKIIQQKDEQISLYKEELIKFSHQLDTVMIQINSDVDMLKRIQKVLAPADLPQIPGFEFSKKFAFGTRFGGDYFDIFEHEDKMKFGILMSSSSGYAMSALFLSLIMKVSHLIEAKKGLSPDQVLLRLSEELKTTANANDQTDVFYGVVDRRDFKLSFCSAGMILGILQEPGQAMRLLKSENQGLSSQPLNEVKPAVIDLQSNMRLSLVSKGVIDALGYDNLCEMVSQLPMQLHVHDVRNEILFQCQQKSGLEHPLRDQTVVVMEVKDRVIKLAK